MFRSLEASYHVTPLGATWGAFGEFLGELFGGLGSLLGSFLGVLGASETHLADTLKNGARRSPKWTQETFK